MLKNYLIIAWRNLKRQKAYTLINVGGLTIGLLCFLLIMLWVQDELSFDKYHANVKRIYRLGIDVKVGDMANKGSSSCSPIAYKLWEEMPEIASVMRFTQGINKLVSWEKGEKNFLENKVFYADSTYFDIFTTKILSGDRKNLLNKKRTIVLTESMAIKYFGDSDPIGEILIFEGRTEYEVTGVIENCPKNSHFQFDFLVSFISIRDATDTNWLSDNINTFIMTNGDYNLQLLTQKVNRVFRKNADAEITRILGTNFEEWEKSGQYYRYMVTPLEDVYMKTDIESNYGISGNYSYLLTFIIIAIFILLIGCVNFTNLSTARSALRAREIGIRKVLGSQRKELIRQLLLETIVLSFISLLISLILAELLLPWFNMIAGKEMTIPLNNILIYPILMLLGLGTGLLAGLYSAISISGINTLTILKGNMLQGRQGSWLRNGLVVFQFSISIIIFICTLIVLNQLNFMRNKDLGFNKDQVLVVDRAYSLGEQQESFKQELLKHASIENVALAFNTPGTGSGGNVYNKENTDPSELYQFRITGGDFNYLDALGIELLEGRFFSPDFASDSSAVVLNEKAVKNLGYDNPVGQFIVNVDDREKHEIIGVIKDFHNSSLHAEIGNMMLLHPSRRWHHYLIVRLQMNNIESSRKFIEDKWHEFKPNEPFEYFFLDEKFENMYRKDQQTAKIFTIFAALAILIACLGLFGLTSFINQQKTKEIGIRKTLGASVYEISKQLVIQFLKWVLFANLIAWPVAYWLMNKWLQNYAYRVQISFLFFFAAALGTMIIAFSTVSWQTLKAARSNPIDALKEN